MKISGGGLQSTELIGSANIKKVLDLWVEICDRAI